MQRLYRTQYGKDPTSDNAIRRWLKQFQDTGSVDTAIETVTPQILENTLREIEYRLNILRAMKGAHVEVV
jgi:transposase-like protein